MVEKTIQLTGTSANSIEDAVNIAVARAAVTIDSIRRVRVLDISAVIEEGAVAQWRVKLDVSFAVQERLHE
ncbi:MAG: dodecin family protein [Candidatus Binatia bacterium]